LIDSSVLFLVEETLSPPYAWLSNWNVSVKFLPSLQQNFTHTHTHTHTQTALSLSLSLIWWTAYACAQFSGCSSMTSAHSETGQMTFCFQNLVLCVLCNVHCQMKLRY
jgi:hypothetical protein